MNQFQPSSLSFKVTAYADLNNIYVHCIIIPLMSDHIVLFSKSYMNCPVQGVWNDDPTDDFVKRDGTLLTPTGTNGSFADADYFEFGETCKFEL